MSKKVNKQQKEQTLDELIEEALVPVEEQPYEVPGNWVWARLKDINDNDIKRGIQPKKYPDETFELYSVPSYSEQIPEIATGKDIGSNKYLVYENDVLLCKINPRINRVWTVGHKSTYRQLASTEWIIIANRKINSKFLLFLFKGPYFRNLLTSNVSGVGGSLTRARPSDVDKYPIALPPLQEQKRIANKVENLLNKIDEAKQLIEEAKETFELRRAAILDKAFRGELTAEWRKANDDVGSEVLLKEIEKIKNSKAKKQQKGTFNSEFNKPFELPRGWSWVRLGELIEFSIYGTSAKANDNYEGVPVLRMGNIVDGNLDLTNLKYLPLDHEDVIKHNLEEFDLLFNRTNSYELVGKTAVVKKEHVGKMTYASYLIKVRLVFKELLADYVCTYINSFIGRNILLSMVTQQVGQANINAQKLASLLIPLPPKKEIEQINKLVKRLVGLEKNVLNNINIEIEARRLQEVILSKAFRGQLGTNDPTEESALELLKEVLEEKLNS
ncbi:type I restriction enzyme S subunit [Desulfitispora alkaliphila]|uniref:restriction endonuclease subunit S n=1 Tax=Desulfitispora alkaliphila TaxID=622674 RepID=UPI003D2072E1